MERLRSTLAHPRHGAARAALALLVASALLAPVAAAKGIEAARGGVIASSLPYRYVAITPRRSDRTVITKIGLPDGKVDRWWSQRGPFYVPAVSAEGGRTLEVLSSMAFARRPLDLADAHPLLRIDAPTLAVHGPLVRAQRRRAEFLAFTRTPRGPGNLVARFGRVGRSVEGRTITLKQYGDPAWPGELLVFGCIHGDECAARNPAPLSGGCPDPGADILVVPNLDPDGRAAGTRLNARGVDLNRNFPSQWRPLGRRGDPQYAGPRPLSEPETRLAARIVRALEPEATIWFHQHFGPRPFVRAWGHSVPAARRFARLAEIPFLLLPWPAGTAPNWQNHRYGGGASFVVERPPGRLGPELRSRLSHALVGLGRWVRED